MYFVQNVGLNYDFSDQSLRNFQIFQPETERVRCQKDIKTLGKR